MTLMPADTGQSHRSSQDDANKTTVWIPTGTFRMGSNDHYPEEAPTHRVTVDGFWIDRPPQPTASSRSS
jgi:formylglycine-generating enzyme required for sulfatase activity